MGDPRNLNFKEGLNCVKQLFIERGSEILDVKGSRSKNYNILCMIDNKKTSVFSRNGGWISDAFVKFAPDSSLTALKIEKKISLFNTKDIKSFIKENHNILRKRCSVASGKKGENVRYILYFVNPEKIKK